jgi:signal transduction histidine kinase
MQPRARRLGLSLIPDVPPSLPEISADPDRLRQVLVNLLDNALKFTPSGGTIRVFAGSDGGQNFIFGVSDTGPGFAPEELARLGQRFAPGNRPGSGSGLGIALSKEILALHGGELKVESLPGRGATVTCSLPLGNTTGLTDRTTARL